MIYIYILTLTEHNWKEVIPTVPHFRLTTEFQRNNTALHVPCTTPDEGTMSFFGLFFFKINEKMFFFFFFFFFFYKASCIQRLFFVFFNAIESANSMNADPELRLVTLLIMFCIWEFTFVKARVRVTVVLEKPATAGWISKISNRLIFFFQAAWNDWIGLSHLMISAEMSRGVWRNSPTSALSIVHGASHQCPHLRLFWIKKADPVVLFWTSKPK